MQVAGANITDELWHARDQIGWGLMKHYRIEKVAKPGGVVVKQKDILAASDRDAMQTAEDSSDCPVCDVLKDGKRIGSIV